MDIIYNEFDCEYEWQNFIQYLLDGIDMSISYKNESELTLKFLSGKLGYSISHTARKFKEMSGVDFRDYLRLRKLAFALADLRSADKTILEVAYSYGFSSNEAFTRAFKSVYGITPSEYRNNPVPVELRKKIYTFDRHLLKNGGILMKQLPGTPEFKCPNFERFIRKHMQKPEGEITSEDMASLCCNFGSGENLGITDITGIEYCVNLNILLLRDNQISDISPLSQLTDLHFLDLSKNKIADISPLTNLTRLRILYLWENKKIADINPLLNLTKLKELDLSGIEIKDTSVLSNFTELERLSFWNQSMGENEKNIDDISFISDMINLKTLCICHTKVSDISPVKKLVNLEHLILESSQISDISPVSKLTNLQTLALCGNQISDISPLKELVNLSFLNLNANKISDISALGGLPNLRELFLNDNPVEDFSFAGHVKPKIEKLPGAPVFKDANFENIIRNQLNKPEGEITSEDMAGIEIVFGRWESDPEISDISGIEYCVNLRQLILTNCCQISDISPLGGLVRLSMLQLFGYKEKNNFNDISPLGGLVNLTDLALSRGEVSDLGPLGGLINLKNLFLDQNPVNSIEPLGGLVNLEILSLQALDFEGETAPSLNIEPLKNFTKLTRLHISKRQIKDIGALRGLINLQNLSLMCDLLCDINPLGGLINLKELFLDCKLLKDINPLGNLSGLEWLMLKSDLLTDISVVNKLINLDRLNLRGSPVGDYSPAAHVRDMQK